MLDSLSVTINLGDAAFPGALSAGSLQLYAQAPSDQLATPEALTWTFGTRILFVSPDRTAGGEPREVTLEDRDGRQVMFRFENGSAWAYPQGKFRDTSRRLFMVDANGVAVTNNPAWYDLSYGNGNSDRFPVQPDASGIRPLAAVYVAGGRWLTLASSGLDVVWDTANALRQIKTASTLADIVTEGDRQYRIDFYAITDVQKTDNLYVSSGAPKMTWRIYNPSALSADRLTITRTSGGSTNVYDAQYTPYFGRWVMTAPGDLRKDENFSFWDASETIREEHRKVLNQAGKVVRHSIKTWQKFAWDQAVVAEVNDPDGAAMTTTNTYYTNPAEMGRYSRLKTVLNSDGSWERYDYDATGRMIEKVSPFGDSPPTALNAQARVTTYSYAPVDPNDTAVLGDQRPRTIVETALGQEVSRTYQAFPLIGGEHVEIVEPCTQPGAAYGAASNQRTVNRYYGATNTVALAGRLRRIERPDGTTASYDYTFGTYNAAQKSFTAGAGTAYRVMVTDGTMDHPEGIANKTTRKTDVYDNRGFNVLSETWVFAGGKIYARIAWTVREFDAFGHATDVLYSNGLREGATWDDCCGKSSDVATDGVRRDYTYDALNRVQMVRRVGNAATGQPDLYTTNVVNAVGNPISQTTFADGLFLTTSNRYDSAGRQIATIDAAGLVTTYAYPNPLTSVTISSGGLLTNTTVRYPDGRARYTEQNGIRQTTYSYGPTFTTVYTGPAGLASPVWQKITTDLLGRTIKTEQPGFSGAGVPPAVLSSVSSYNTLGQLIRTSEYSSLSASAPLRENLFSYDPLGNAILTAQDLNLNGVIDLAGPDRVSSNATEFVQIDGDWFGESRSYTFPEGNSTTALLTGLQRTRLTGLGLNTEFGIQNSEFISQDLLGNQTLSRTFIDRDHAVRVGLVSTPDSTNAATQVTVNGLAQYSISKTGVRTDYAYDALSRQISARVDAASSPRSVGSVTHYNSLGQVDWVADALSNRTTFTYCPTTGRRIAVTDALTNTVHTAYDPEGRVIATWGATYPVVYTFDDYGLMVGMGTYRGTNVIESLSDFNFLLSAFDRTTWSYDQPTGLLTNKVYADGKGPSYTYTPQGQLATRKWARGVQTTYSYTNTTGELIGIDYSDATPDVTFAFNRIGQPITITDGTGTRAFAYNDALQLAAETNAFGVLARAYDGLGRSAGFSLFNPANPVNPVQSIAYGYNSLGRFQSVSSSVFSVSSVVNYSYLPGTDLLSGYTNSAGFAVARAFEAHRDLVSSVANTFNGQPIGSFAYANDELTRRVSRIDTASSSQPVTNLFGYNPRSELASVRMGTNAYGYAFDPIGNRQLASANALTNRYTANALNQYTNILRVSAPPREDIPAYDLDGNLTNYNGWSFAWDAENRLTSAEQVGTAVPAVRFAYDYLSRRYQKIAGTTTNTFLYDGWAMIQERQHTPTHTLTNSYVYGLDLSGSIQGAGTIGGLLSAVLTKNEEPGTKNLVFYFYDANGNVSDLLTTNGTSLAHYEFDPYGNATVSSGSLASSNPFRFSTKYTDDETGMCYYGYRYLWDGRWINRDPLGEKGGVNVYAYVGGDPVNNVDPLGLDPQMTAYRIVQGNLPPTSANLACTDGVSPDTWYAMAEQSRPVDPASLLRERAVEAERLENDRVAQFRMRHGCSESEYATGLFDAISFLLALLPDPTDLVSVWRLLARTGGDDVARLAAESRLALPAARQVEYSWGALNTYREGGQMTAIEHINYRHAVESGFSDVSRFAEGTSVRDVQSFVDQASRYGTVTPQGANAFRIEYNLGRTIGTGQAGEAATGIRVFIRNGQVQTAFPIAP
jgi:RHS repeat-associated protein